MTSDPFAALLDGVQRHDPHWYGPHESGRYVLLSDVLAALAAAYPADLAEAGKVLEGVTPGPWVSETLMHDDPNGDEWPTDVEVSSQSGKHIYGHDLGYNDDVDAEIIANARFIAWCREGVPALLARIAAQEAHIGEQGRLVRDLTKRARDAEEQRDQNRDTAIEFETALAAERAKVAKLVEALNQYQLAAAGYVSVQSAKDKADAVLSAIAEAGQ